MSSITDKIRARLGIPSGRNGAQYVVIFDQAAHLDWDWIQTFDEYFLTAYSGVGVNGALLSALKLLAGNQPGSFGPYYYSMCEMGYLQKFVSYQAQQGNDVVSQIKSAGENFRIVGGGITSPDSLLCSGEAFIRNYLLGRLWLAETFPELLPLNHCWIPDDFGQDPELPVVVQAMGLLSIAFSRLPGTTSAPNPELQDRLLKNGLDFFWQSSDTGSQVYTHWINGGYGQGSSIDQNSEVLKNISGFLANNSANNTGIPPFSGAPTNYLYVPIDNDFQMPVTDLLSDMQQWNCSESSQYGYNATGVFAVAASFDDFVSLVLDNSDPLQTFNYNGTPYWTGYYMSRPEMKILHYDTVRWLSAAEVFGLLASQGYFLDPLYWRRLSQAWTDFMPSTHHDYVCGTANDWVYQIEQLPLLQTARDEARGTALTALQALGSSIMAFGGSNPVVIANPAGVPYSGVVELPAPVPSGMQGIVFGGTTTNLVQPTNEGGLVFLASVNSLGYTTGYLTETSGTIPSTATITPNDSDESSYTLTNDYLTVVISAASNWGIQSITDSAGNSLLAPGGVGNELVFYQDAGNLYQFGNECGVCFSSQPVTVETGGSGFGAAVLESGPVRVRLQTTVGVQGLPSAQNYTREYILVAGEPFLRMKSTGAAPQASENGYSVMTAFPLTQPVDTIVHGTPCHWTSVQPLPDWNSPIFQATHRFLLPQAGSTVLGALYHRDVPAWAFAGSDDVVLGTGALIGCLFRNTPNDAHGAAGSDTGTHTLEYALRTFQGLGDPTTGQPFAEALGYSSPPLAALINPVALNLDPTSPCPFTLPENGFVASVESPGVILAAKPGDVNPETLVLRLYQPTNSSETLSISLGAFQASAVVAATALEDPITENGPVVSVNAGGFTIESATALNTVLITPVPQIPDLSEARFVDAGMPTR